MWCAMEILLILEMAKGYRGRRKNGVPGAPTRLWLHARALILPSPLLGDATAGDLVFEAPLPSELLDHLTALRDALVPHGSDA